MIVPNFFRAIFRELQGLTGDFVEFLS